MEKDRIEMSQRERDVLKVMSVVMKGERTQAEAARLLERSVRQVRRIQRKLEKEGDKGVVHGLRGRPSNRRLEEGLKVQALAMYRQSLSGVGPTMASEKLAEGKMPVARETLRRWLLEAGLWTRSRRRDRHRQRRSRKECFGEMVQADASEHDWLEGRGPALTLVGMIDDATDRAMAWFCESETTEAYMGLLWRWLEQHGRPLAWYCDRHSIFRAESRLLGQSEPVSVPTQFSRALGELNIELKLANSPQAKGRIERFWGTCQDRLVKELRLAGARNMEQANVVLQEKFLPWFNRTCVHKPSSGNDAHRALGKGQDLGATLSHQETRTVGNDYTFQFHRQVYQLLPPAWPGLRGGQVVIEQRLDGSRRVRFKGRYLEYQAVPTGTDLGALPPDPRSLSHGPIPAGAGSKGRGGQAPRPSAVHRAGGCSGRTAALPCPPVGGSCGMGKDAWRPEAGHPWRKGYLRASPREADISTGRS